MNKYRYNDAKEGNVTMQYAIIQSVLLILLDVVNTVVHARKKEAVQYRYFLATEIIVMYFVFSFTTPATFFRFCVWLAERFMVTVVQFAV